MVKVIKFEASNCFTQQWVWLLLHARQARLHPGTNLGHVSERHLAGYKQNCHVVTSTNREDIESAAVAFDQAVAFC